MPVQILLICDDPLVRSALDALLTEMPEASVCASIPLMDWNDRESAIQPVDAIVFDPGWNPVSARQALSSFNVYSRVLVLLPDGVDLLDPVLALFQGVVSRSSGRGRLFAAINAVAAGLKVREHQARGSLVPGDEPMPAGSLLDPLTPREIEVLACMVEGLPNKLIASRLKISEHTAKFHVTSILSKLGVQSRTEAVVRAARLGLVRM